MLKIPYWKQTTEASCGPACLLMVFNYLNPKYGLSKGKEWELWRETSLLTWRGTHPYGLSLALLRRGHKVDLIRSGRKIWQDVNFSLNNSALKYAIQKQEKESKRLGLKEKIKKKISLEDLNKYIKKGKIPILLIQLIKKDNSLGFAHWVILLGIDKKYVILNDPYVSGNRKVPKKTFLKSWNMLEKLKEGFSKEILLIKIH